jgi:hypothetical protein
MSEKIAELLVHYYNEMSIEKEIDEKSTEVVIESLEDDGFDVGVNEYGQIEMY